MRGSARSLWLPTCALLWLAPPASAVDVEWIFVGDPSNACETHRTGFRSHGCFGAVGNGYDISRYEITNAQYAEFLNAKAASDPLELYSANMDPSAGSKGGIIRTGIPGSYTYTAVAGRTNRPVNHVSFYDAARFANWLENDQGNGDTETGSYTLLGGTPEPDNGATVARNGGTRVFIANEDEWYKAAYYDTVTRTYFDNPAFSDTPATCTAPTPLANSANCDADGLDPVDLDVDGLTAVGAFVDSASPDGTFDQGGNVGEWTDTVVGAASRVWRGGSYNGIATNLAAADRRVAMPNTESSGLGFRVVLPEPRMELLQLTGVLALVVLRRFRRAQRAMISGKERDAMRRHGQLSRRTTVNGRDTRPGLAAALAALLVLCAATSALAAPLTYIERNLTPDTPSHGAGEPQIAVSPTNPTNIVYVSTYYRYVGVFLPGPNQYGDPDYEYSFVADITSGVTFVGGPFDFLNCFIAVSEDRGETWTPGKWPNGNRPFCGDPMMHVDSNGVFYGAMDWMGHPTEQCSTANSSDPVAVFRSTDGGHNWSSPLSTGTQTDRPWMRVDTATGKIYEESGFFGRKLAFSADLGQTWSAPVAFTNGSHIAVYDGILATWGSGNFHFSTDDGQTYTSLPVTDPGGAAIDPVGLSGGWISADPTKKGRFAVMSRTGNNYQLWVTSDTGQTWTTSPPIPAPNATLPWMDFGWSGVLAVMWKNSSDGNVYSAVSTDKGATFSVPKRVNSVPAVGTCPGDDLSWIASDKDYTYIGWAHQHNSQCDAFFARVPLGCYNGTAPASSCPSF